MPPDAGEMLEAGASVSLYMFHGGTNFGFMNGANAAPGPNTSRRSPATITTPRLDEAGDLTPKYHACREVIGATALPDRSCRSPNQLRPLHTAQSNWTQCAGLLDNLDALHPGSFGSSRKPWKPWAKTTASSSTRPRSAARARKNS